MKMIDYLIGQTKGQLETQLRLAQAELLAGKTMVTAGAGDLTFSHRVEMEIRERIELILKKLSALDPVAYPPESVTPIDRTQIVFAGLQNCQNAQNA